MQENNWIDEEFFSDALLKQAVVLARDKYLSSIVIPPQECVFSKRFERKMKRIIRFARKRETAPTLSYSAYTHKRVALCIALAIVLSLIFSVGVAAASGKLFVMLEKVFPKYSIVTYQPNEDLIDDVPDSIKNKPFVEYELTFLPEGYTLTEEMVVPELKEKYVTYSDKNNSYYGLDQFPIERTDFMINTEGTTLESFVIDEIEYHYCSNLGMQMLFWDNGEYVFLIVGDIDKETAIKLAQSTKIKEK